MKTENKIIINQALNYSYVSTRVPTNVVILEPMILLRPHEKEKYKNNSRKKKSEIRKI